MAARKGISMFVHVTQVLPEGQTQPITVNTELVEDAQPWQGHTMLVLESGRTIEITATPAQWDVLMEGV